MTELADVHRALADRVRQNVAREFNVSPFPFSHMPVPYIEVWPSDGEDYVDYYGESDSDDGPMRVRLQLKVQISTQDGETSFNTITDLLTWDGPSSLRTVVMADRSLGGVVEETVVMLGRWETDEANEAQTAWVPVEIVVTK